jgi:hypothetical protein
MHLFISPTYPSPPHDPGARGRGHRKGRNRELEKALLLWCAACIVPPDARAAAPPDGARAGRDAPASRVLLYEHSSTVRLRVGLRIRARGGAIQHVLACSVAPLDWPEQRVKLVGTEEPAGGRVETRRLGGTAAQVMLRLPQLAAGSEAAFTRTYEITRWTQRVKPDAWEELHAASPRDVRTYLEPSDGIESAHAEIRRFARDTLGDRSDAVACARCLFDATREHVNYVEGPFAGALAALRSGRGDCEERACLFIALCRAGGIPARLIWGRGHCWSEIGLEDGAGELVWIPADPTRERELGTVSHFCPIFQKGDRFRLPELSNRSVRYLMPHCTGIGRTPEMESIEEEAAP